MNHPFDEFSKSLAGESVPRRESLRRLGAALAGALVGPLVLGSDVALANPDNRRRRRRRLTASAPKQGNTRNACMTFCKRCATKSQRDQCLSACRTCNSDPGRLQGTCGDYACCPAGTTLCGSICVDLKTDPRSCGACGHACNEFRANTSPQCVSGTCIYSCVAGAVDCDGTCVFLSSDPANCGACGHVCPASAPYCQSGICVGCPAGTTNCNGACTNLMYDRYNCGACGVVCEANETCIDGACQPNSEDCTPDNPYYPNC